VFFSFFLQILVVAIPIKCIRDQFIDVSRDQLSDQFADAVLSKLLAKPVFEHASDLPSSAGVDAGLNITATPDDFFGNGIFQHLLPQKRRKTFVTAFL
jgi:hypothetical protein